MAVHPTVARLSFCREHGQRHREKCWSCDLAVEFSVLGQRCACGAKATGYRTMSAYEPVEYFCDEHFQDVPELVAPTKEEQS